MMNEISSKHMKHITIVSLWYNRTGQSSDWRPAERSAIWHWDQSSAQDQQSWVDHFLQNSTWCFIATSELLFTLKKKYWQRYKAIKAYRLALVPSSFIICSVFKSTFTNDELSLCSNSGEKCLTITFIVPKCTIIACVITVNFDGHLPPNVNNWYKI